MAKLTPYQVEKLFLGVERNEHGQVCLVKRDPALAMKTDRDLFMEACADSGMEPWEAEAAWRKMKGQADG